MTKNEEILNEFDEKFGTLRMIVSVGEERDEVEVNDAAKGFILQALQAKDLAHKESLRQIYYLINDEGMGSTQFEAVERFRDRLKSLIQKEQSI